MIHFRIQISEYLSLAVMLLMIVALVAGQASTSANAADNVPVVDNLGALSVMSPINIEYFRSEDK